MLNTFDYIKCFENTFWEWDLDDEYLHLKDGVTFAHWEDVKEYLINLVPMGLPLFDVFAGIMAATMSDELSSVGLSIQSCLAPNEPKDQLSDRFRIFETMGQVEEKYKRGSNRFLFVATVLEKVNVKLIDSVSTKIAAELKDSEMHFFGARGKTAEKHLKKVVNCFSALNSYFPDSESIVEAMMGFNMRDLNLDDVIPRTEESTQDVKYAFLEQLQNEIRTEKIAALIPYMISGMNFPIHSKQSDDRPDGGVSDLSNKGHFDQLIVSEFAYDDDYFMSRIVNNEALFYQHEKAKNDNDDDVCVLIDSSLYMWGLPKLLATAVGCTIGMKQEDSAVDCFVVGTELLQCDFNSIEGVLKGIGFTDASISPAEGINLFVEAGKTYSNTLLITTEQSWKRPEMMRIREESKHIFDFVVFTNENAEIKVLKSKGKQVANFKLDLETIWALKKNNVPRKPARAPSVYPILFPISTNRIKYFFQYNEDIFFIDKSKGVFHVEQNESKNEYSKGARLLMRIGFGLDVLGDIGLNADGEFELLMFCKSRKEVVIYNLAQASEKNFEFGQWTKGMRDLFYYQNDTFYFMSREGQWVFDENFTSQSKILPLDIDLYKAATGRAATIRTDLVSFQKYFIKAKTVYVSDQGELVIRGRRLETSDEMVTITNPPVGSLLHRPIMTRLGEQQTFTFASGESIITNPSGMIEFQYNERNRPLGYELRLTQIGGNKLATVKTLRTATGKGLKLCKEIIDKGSGAIMISHDETKLNKTAFDLRELGNKVSVTSLQLGMRFYMTSVVDLATSLASSTFFAGNTSFKDEEMSAAQRDITPMEFYDLYLRAFIQNINNGI